MGNQRQWLLSGHAEKILAFTLLSSTLGFSLGCAPGVTASVQQASESISDALTCQDSQSKIFDAFYALVDQEQKVPSSEALKASLDQSVSAIFEERNVKPAPEKIEKLKSELHQLIDLMLSESLNNPKLGWKDQVQKLIELEMQDRSDLGTFQTAQKISSQTKLIQRLSAELKVDCPHPTTPTPALPTVPALPKTPVSQAPAATSPLMSKGLNRVFATAYQSCRVLDLPEMDSGTPAVDGIWKDPDHTHEDGIGGIRHITDLAAVQNTHYYLRGIASESSCRDMKKTPLIYDYGGSPAVTATTINFFTNAGSGTEVLGVDCSAYVSSGIAVAGLRYKTDLANKPIYIRQNSSKFIDAELSNFTCFENVTVTKAKSVQSGDIVGIHGHVVMVDKVGEDPFGLRLLKSVDQCSSLNYKNFDIVVSQSSPSKNGIGINKYSLQDYLDESPKMETAFVQMGRQACLAYFQNKAIKPKSTEWGFLRHKGTAECLAPRVSLVGESCTQKCF